MTIKRDDKGKFVKGAPSANPLGKAAGREVINKEIVEALHYAFNTAHPDGAKGYMLDIAREKPALFVGLLGRVMPNEVAVTATISLGDAMRAADERLASFQAKILEHDEIVPGEHPRPSAASRQLEANSQGQSVDASQLSAIDNSKQDQSVDASQQLEAKSLKLKAKS